MIQIKKSTTADTRTCDWSTVTKEQLIESTEQHINDVQQSMRFYTEQINWTILQHDYTKIEHIDEFYADFKTGFKENSWYEMHKRVERHLSVSEGVRDDVDLIDVLEHIADCVMAGMARSGNVYDLNLSNELLQKAFQNTVKNIKRKCRGY